MNNSSVTVCSCCGGHHPAGAVCGQFNMETEHEDPGEESDSTPGPDQCLPQSTGSCCGCAPTAEAVADLAALGKPTATRAIFRIVNMDCPMEEALIRKKLGSLPGITGLEFNLMQRVLTVNHELPSTRPIIAALNSIDMTPETLGQNEGVLAVFSIDGLDCPLEENLIRSKLNGLPGLLGLEFNLMQRTLKIRHEPQALPAISEALLSLNMGARLLDREAGTADSIPAPKIPWRNLIVAGVFAAFSEAFELIGEWNASPLGINVQAWEINGVQIIEWLPLFFAVLAIALSGLTTYRKGWLAVKNLNLNINALMSVAVTGAVLIGQYPEAAMVMVLFSRD